MSYNKEILYEIDDENINEFIMNTPRKMMFT